MRGIPAANAIQTDAFRAYLERQIAANHAFVDKLLHAKDFNEALRIQAEYFQTQLKSAADNAAQLGSRWPFRRSDRWADAVCDIK